jgi:hypothetical protein
MPAPKKPSGKRDRMRLNIHRGEAPELFATLSNIVARSKGDRLRYLATLGLKAEAAGIYLEGRSLDGKLVMPLVVSAVAVPASSSPATPAAPASNAPPVGVKSSEFSAFTASVLGINRSPKPAAPPPAPSQKKAIA